MKHPEFLVPTQMQVERKVKPQNLWWVEYYTDFYLVLVSPSSSIVNQKLLVLKAASSILGCLGVFHHLNTCFWLVLAFFPRWLEGFLLLRQLRALPE